MNTKVREAKSAALLKTASLLSTQTPEKDKERCKKLAHYEKVLSGLTFFFGFVVITATQAVSQKKKTKALFVQLLIT